MKKTLVVLLAAAVLAGFAGVVSAQEAPQGEATAPDRGDIPIGDAEAEAVDDQRPGEQGIAPTSESQDTHGLVLTEQEHANQKHWRNSIIWLDIGSSVYSFDRAGQLTYDPTVAMNIRFMPRWYFNDDLFLRARLDFDVEFTQSDTTTTTRQPLFSNVTLDLIKRNIVKAGPFALNAGPRLVLPLSLQSQAEHMILGLGASANASLNWPHIGDGLTLMFDLSYVYNFSGSNVGHVNNPFPCEGFEVSGHAMCDVTGGPSSILQQGTVGPGVIFSPMPKVSIFSIFWWFVRQARPLGTENVPIGNGVATVGDTSRTHARDLTLFYFSVGYDLTKWGNLSAYFLTFSPELNPDGSRRNPFFNYDSTVGLNFTVTLDEFYDAFMGGTEAPAEHIPGRQAMENQRRNIGLLTNTNF